MKKSDLYRLAMLTVIDSENIDAPEKLEIVQLLTEDEALGKYRETTANMDECGFKNADV